MSLVLHAFDWPELQSQGITSVITIHPQGDMNIW